jgi:hypothetical protein
MRLLFWAAWVIAAASGYAAQGAAQDDDPREIILRSAEFEARNIELIRNYTFLQHLEQRKLDSSGKVKDTERKTHEILMLYGRPYQRLVAEDGKPLPPDKERKEQEKLDKEMEKRRNESPKAREKRLREEQKDLEEERQFRLEVADAFNFTVAGEDEINGYATWVIEAAPKTDYKPRSREGKILPKVRGKLWVSKVDYRWVRIEAEVIDTFSFGWMLLRVHPGTRLLFEGIKAGGEVWMPKHAYVRGNGRLAMLKKLNLEIELNWDNYRKFQTDSRIVPEPVEDH